MGSGWVFWKTSYNWWYRGRQKYNTEVSAKQKFSQPEILDAEKCGEDCISLTSGEPRNDVGAQTVASQQGLC